MSIRTRHPDITPQRLAEWRLMRDAMDGEGAIKARGELYLPRPGGFAAQPDKGAAMYEAYRARARFPDILAPSVAGMIGIIHSREAKITMPSAMEYLWEAATADGLPLEAFHRRITRELLLIGGYAVLADAPPQGGLPYLTGYRRDALISWDRDWYVLDESALERSGFTWRLVERYRELRLGPGGYEQVLYTAPDLTQGQVVEVRARAGQRLQRIPLVVGTSRDLTPAIETPPLIGIARAALAIYQLSADYRHQLFMSGQETLVALNGPAPTVIGAGVVHQMIGDGVAAPDLKYVSPTCAGIAAHKAAMEDELLAAGRAGARLLERVHAHESGEARRLRFRSETATLLSIAQASAAILERALRHVATMLGLDETAVIVDAPSDLLDRAMSPEELATLFGIYQQGGMSWETYYANAQRGGLMSPERDAAAELALLEEQQGAVI